VADELKKTLTSYHFKKRLLKREAQRLLSLKEVNIDYSETFYNKEEHHKRLEGISSRQYVASFFEDTGT
jgi:hypothetical protein